MRKLALGAFFAIGLLSANASAAGDLSIYESGYLGVGNQEVSIRTDDLDDYIKAEYWTAWDIVDVYTKNDISTVLWRCRTTGETKETSGLIPPDVKLNVFTGDYEPAR